MAIVGGLKWAGRLSIVLVAVLALSWALQHDTPRASASHSEILVSKSGTSIQSVASIVMMLDGPSQLYYVWAKNVDNSTGASAFDIWIGYNSNLLTLSTLLTETAWLESTNRNASCQPTIIDPNPVTGEGTGRASCGTLLPPPPYGPGCFNNHCSGQIGKFIITPRDQVGQTIVDLSGSFLVDTPANPANQTTIPTLKRSVVVNVAPCADFPPGGGDGRVRALDISYVVQRYFGTSPDDLTADLNADNRIRADDIVIAVKQFFLNCP